ncbi:hypothetical protein FHW12_003227 [Dokdonella fugitiva]|uniref:Uncharacterized protein n=1 Tax=Dokdonella fugitiva TaxID=328517 RepID=A0A839FA11_9GAMM|nr:hypothetical protein [Dokdonella fugitiva]MBA8888991.1 hypothetical protein [Dokdonella fugitiva]
MACFPKIDQPCPLGIDEQRRIAGYCGRCSKAVHSLDGMSDAERVSFVRAAKGPMCVTYRAAGRGAAIGLGAALALSAPAAQSQDTLPYAPQVQSQPTQPTPPPPGIYGYPSSAQEHVDLSDQKIESITITGGVSDPATVEFVDASDALPELPLVHEADPAAPR